MIAVSRAAEAGMKPSRHRAKQISKAWDILSGLTHPEAESRMTAKQMRQLKWLQAAAAVPLPPCPVDF